MLSVVNTVIVYNSICVFQCCLLSFINVIVCTNFHLSFMEMTNKQTDGQLFH